jgi:hypothetical protein
LERHVRICREVFAKKRAQVFAIITFQIILFLSHLNCLFEQFDSQGARLADTGVDQVQIDTAAAEKRELLVARNKSRHSWKKLIQFSMCFDLNAGKWWFAQCHACGSCCQQRQRRYHCRRTC